MECPLPKTFSPPWMIGINLVQLNGILTELTSKLDRYNGTELFSKHLKKIKFVILE